MMVANTGVLKDNPNFGKALAGIWYDTMAVMTADSDEGKAARQAMGVASGTDLAGFEAQLAATKLFPTARRRGGLHRLARPRDDDGHASAPSSSTRACWVPAPPRPMSSASNCRTARCWATPPT